ncbi:MAG: hypothetical protein WCJ75_17510 [Desulfomonile sp.]
MIAIENRDSSTETVTARRDVGRASQVLAVGAVIFAALSPCSHAEASCAPKFHWKKQNWESETCSNCLTQETLSSSEVHSIRDSPKDRIRTCLNLHQLIPSRVHETVDGSELIQFLGAAKACVDVYPNGDVIVIVEKGENDEYYSLKTEDALLVASILKNAGVPTRV